jgi:heat shock protein HslJ
MVGLRATVRWGKATLLPGLLAVSIMACGSGAGSGAALDGREFRSQEVSGHELVRGTQIALEFRADEVRARAGCNLLAAPYAVRDSALVIAGGAMSTTEMGCTPERHAQDDWLVTFLTGSPRLELDGSTLTLELDRVRIELLDRVVADPDRPLTGTRWFVDTVLSSDTARSVADPSSVQLDFRSDGTVTVSSAGCTSAVVDYRLDGDAVRFGTVTVDAIGCPDPWPATVDVLRAGSVRWTIVAARLTLRADRAGVSANGAG